MLSRFEVYPFARWPVLFRKRALVLLLVAAIGISMVLAVVGGPLVTQNTPRGILDYEFANTAAAARAVQTAWGPAGIAAAQRQTLIDFAYLLVYGPLLSIATGLAVWVWARRSTLFGWIGVALSWGGLLASVLDAIENIAMLNTLGRSITESLTQLANICAYAKFGIIVCGMIYALMGAALWLGDRIIAIGKLWYRSVVDEPPAKP
jgi:hypothetical protein